MTAIDVDEDHREVRGWCFAGQLPIVPGKEASNQEIKVS